ncbi:hypothetical protein ABZY68_25355 [Streptomyces sp. NPDC006482]|uniref:hypothetical protein n=1 Tax=Streptomyces sp. NPDC006482 TaxID=3154306 RepID=UPI0033A0BA29
MTVRAVTIPTPQRPALGTITTRGAVVTVVMVTAAAGITTTAWGRYAAVTKSIW